MLFRRVGGRVFSQREARNEHEQNRQQSKHEAKRASKSLAGELCDRRGANATPVGASDGADGDKAARAHVHRAVQLENMLANRYSASSIGSKAAVFLENPHV